MPQVRSSIDRAKARMQSKQSSVSKRGAASALLLEAGRVSRGHMLREAVRRAETNIGHALTKTFKPIQHVLAGNEKVTALVNGSAHCAPADPLPGE